MASPDWKKIKMYYLQNDVSLRELAAKFKVGEASVFRRASKEKWKDEKIAIDSKVIARTIEKTAEKSSESLAEYAVRQTADLVKINELLIGKVFETMAYGDAFSPRDLKSLSGMLYDLMMNRKTMMEEQTAGASDADKVTVEFVKPYWETE